MRGWSNVAFVNAGDYLVYVYLLRNCPTVSITESRVGRSDGFGSVLR